MQRKGIDISEFNGDVDLAGMKGQIDFVIIRCGYGSDITGQDDSMYHKNVEKCKEVGIPYGVYLYSYAQNVDMAKSEAAHTLRLLNADKPSYGVWYDVEDSSLPQGQIMTDICKTYCSTIENQGLYCGIYSYLSFFNSVLNSSELDIYDKWVAQWSDKLEYGKPYGIWQYTNAGRINGQVFDLNYAYKDYPSITGGEDLTTEQAREIAQSVYTQNEQKYKTIGDVPGWAHSDVLKVYDTLGLGGTKKGKSGDDTVIDASETYIRLIYIISKALEL